MGLLEQAKKLFRTSGEELAERYLSPEAVLDRYIGELTNNLESARAALFALRTEVERLGNRVRELKADESMWERKASAALLKLKDEELAREALRRKARARAESAELERIIAAHNRDIAVMEKNLEPLEGKIVAAKNKKERLQARKASDMARKEVKQRLDDSGIGDFQEVEEQLLELEAQANTLNDLKLLSLKDASFPLPEIESDIEKELERIREESEQQKGR